ncbi:MAG: hypothetical protein ACD_76C00109G0006 [uncultured bacterium]|nr:MAG: hypothetical protein ACD_76C00109G0006 [uncultured bacterium]HBD04930.1 metal-dependent hydrolase [Candidatus Uhrbacteria bacterium]
MEETISYKIKQSKRAKKVRIAVYCDGSVAITTPYGIDRSIIDGFIYQKKQWIHKKIRYFKNFENKTIRTFSRKDYLENKNKAFSFVNERVKFYNQLYCFSYNKIFIKNQKTRWGSCSRKKNLNLNYKILFLPQMHQDYIIVHEICHLKEFNHSQEFWALVEQTIPDYLKIRKELRKNELFFR